MTSNPIATITNNLGYDVDIYDVFNPNASTQGLLKYTKLATVPNAATAQQVQTINFASQLQAMRTGNITALNNNYYQQFPVAVLAVSPFAASNAFTLTSDMQQGMEESFQFIKYVQANPASQTATSFNTALGDKTSQKNAVNAFFQGTASFQKCTLATWTAVFSWQAQFTNPWQGTNYLYSLGSSGTGDTGAVAPALVATLAIVASAQASSAVLTMAGTNNQNTPVVMVGDGTMQEQNPGTGNLSVSLTPTWLNITQTSQQNGETVTSYVIAAAFTGTINGVKVSGNLNQLAIPSPSDTSQNASDKNASNIFSIASITELVGMLTSIGMLYYMARGHKMAETQKQNDAQKDATSKSDAANKENKVEADYQAKDVPVVSAKSQQVEAVVPEVAAGYKKVDQAADIQNKEAAVENQENELEVVLEGGAPSKATEDAAVNLVKARTDLEKSTDPATSATGRDAAVTDATTNLTSTTTELTKELQNQGNQLSQEEQRALQDTDNVLKAEQQQADATKETEVEQEKQDQEKTDQEVDKGEFEDPKAEDPAPVVAGE